MTTCFAVVSSTSFSYTSVYNCRDSADHIHFGEVLHVNNLKVGSLKQRQFLLSESQAERFMLP